MEEPVEIVSGDFLNFSKNHLITGINVIEDLLFWTDNYNQPRKININKAINDPTYYDSEDKISVAKIAPYAAPLIHEHQNLHTVTTENTIGKYTDDGVNDNGLGQDVESDYLRENFVRFSYRYKYEDNEYSLIAPFTQVVFEPLNNGCIIDDADETDIDGTSSATDRANYEFGTKRAIDTSRIATMQNAINRVKLRIPLPYNNDALTATTERTLSTTYTDASTVIFTGGSVDSGHYILKGAYSNAPELENAKTNDITQFITSASHDLTTSTVLDKGSITSDHLTGQYNIAFVPMWENHVGLKSIEILIKESDDAAVRVVGEIDVRDIRDFKDNVDVYPIKPWSSFTQTYYRYCYVFDYKSEKPYKVIPEDQVNRVSDDVPIRAQAQEVVSNRVVYGNYLKNYQYPTDAAGNKGINYIVTSLAKGEYEHTASEPKYWLNLQHNEHAYRYGSLKQRRTYQVGVVLSDRYGRQSPVILSSAKKGNNATTQINSPDTITTTNQTGDSPNGYSLGPNGSSTDFTWSQYELDVIGRTLGIEFQDSFLVPADQSYSANNNLGWYSYRVVVKQTQQDYYNVYVPHPQCGGIDVSEPSYITLFSDNINKVPRSILDQDINRNNISGSDVFLFPKVQGDGDTKPSKLQTSYSSKLIDVISLGTIQEQDSEFDLTNGVNSRLSTLSNKSRVYKHERGPLVAEIDNMKTLYATGNNPDNIKGLTVFETEPFDSKLDIYYETSTTGLVTDLNWALQLAPPASAPEEDSIQFQGGSLTKSFNENAASGTVIGTVEATPGDASNTLVYELLNLWSYNGVGRDDFKNRVSLNTSNRELTLASGVDAGTGFAHRNSDYDKYDVVLKVSEYDGKDYTGSSIRTLQIQVNNSAPSIQLYDDDGVLNQFEGTAKIGFYQKYGIKLDNGYRHSGLAENGGTDNVEKYRGLTYEITFPNIANTALRTWAERSFEVEQRAGGKIDILTTWVWEINENWNQSPLNIAGAGDPKLTKQSFFDLLPAQRTMTITVSDNAATPLTNTVDLEVNEAVSLLKINDVYTFRVKEHENILSNISINFDTDIFISRGTSVNELDAANPQVGNIVYIKKGNPNKGEAPTKFSVNQGDGAGSYPGNDLFVVYRYAKIGNEIESVYNYMVIAEHERTISGVTYAESSILDVGTIEVPSSSKAYLKFIEFGDDIWLDNSLSENNKLFDLIQFIT